MSQGQRPLMDITGDRFGRLVAEHFAGRDGHGNAIWACVCDCGVRKTVRMMTLKAGRTQSCGCLRTEVLAAKARQRFRTHGMRRSPEYAAWKDLRRRCTNPMAKSFKNYGARGIKVCEEWMVSFDAFFASLGPRPSPQHSIDRIDNDGHYEPGNCRWATIAQQNSNKRPSRVKK